MSKVNTQTIAAVVLAGGKSQRMAGHNKLNLPFGNRTLLEHTIEKLRRQLKFVVLNCNERATLSPSLNEVPVIADRMHGEAGPLDGLISSMEWLRQHEPTFNYLLSVPVDCPFIPENYLQKLKEGIEETKAQLAFAKSGDNKHFICALWSLDLAEKGREFLNKGNRALKHFIAEQQHLEVNFEQIELDPFFNINTPEDYAHALSLLATL